MSMYRLEFKGLCQLRESYALVGWPVDYCSCLPVYDGAASAGEKWAELSSAVARAVYSIDYSRRNPRQRLILLENSRCIDNLSKMSDVKSLEHPTLKVPYELLNKKFRSAQKALDREVSHVQAAANELEKGLKTNGTGVATGEITRLLGGVVARLQVLKRKAEESIAEELQAGMVCKRRLYHLKEHSSTAPSAVNQWRRQRLDRMLIEYFLRKGYYKTANKLADSVDLRDLTNIDVFMVSREVEKSLANHETTRCLNWCHDNRSKLRKLGSTMEFNLRVQEFIELVRSDRRLDAVKHARKCFANYDDYQLHEIQSCMGQLAFPANAFLSPYKDLLDEKRWDRLIEQFRHENYRLFQLASQSVFTVALQAGLSALKTPQCYSKDGKNPSCPVCNEALNELAASLPFAHCSQSRLVCSISGKPLNEYNHPMMMPNGYVYGEQALEKMAQEYNGAVICPKTKEAFPFRKIEKVYVM